MSEIQDTQKYLFRVQRLFNGTMYKETISANDCVDVSLLISKIKQSQQLRLYSVPCSLNLRDYSNEIIDPFMEIEDLCKIFQELPKANRIISVECIEDPKSKRLKLDPDDLLNYCSITKLLDLLEDHGIQSETNILAGNPRIYGVFQSFTKETWFEKVHDENLSVKLYDIMHETTFKKSNYKTIFPFFDEKNEFATTMLDREEATAKINEIAWGCPWIPTPKFNPFLIITSCGMGKTYFMIMIALQNVDDSYKCQPIIEARDCGRIISFDFLKNTVHITNEVEAESFLKQLLIFFLCLIFDKFYVDGIYFESVSFRCINQYESLKNENLRRMIPLWMEKSFDFMMAEYIRLTNIAFETVSAVPPVFLFDEIQTISKPTDIKSENGNYHTSLSLLFKTLSNTYQPSCICSGLNDGNIEDLKEGSGFIPIMISLPSLVKSAETFWENMAKKHQIESKFNRHDNLIQSLIFASYQIPRLLCIAFMVWMSYQLNGFATNEERVLQQFEESSATYYFQSSQALNNFSVHEMAHILLACGVRYDVEDSSTVVPGTAIPWKSLIARSIVFPHGKGYVFPFSYLWIKKETPNNIKSQAQKDIESLCSTIVKGLHIKDLHFNYDSLCKCNLKNIGLSFEKMIAASLAVRYYLISLSTTDNSKITLANIYSFETDSGEDSAEVQLGSVTVDLHNGIAYPETEFFKNSDNTPFDSAIIHNIKAANAHHDLFIPTGLGLIPIQVKSSFDKPKASYLRSQFQISKGSPVPLDYLIVVTLEVEKTEIVDSIVYLSGRGAINGLTLCLYTYLKKIKSQINRPENIE
jgi:hypothetical protein